MAARVRHVDIPGRAPRLDIDADHPARAIAQALHFRNAESRAAGVISDVRERLVELRQRTRVSTPRAGKKDDLGCAP
jgi:hypothetical protein